MSQSLDAMVAIYESIATSGCRPFKAALQEHQINGEVLLNDVDKELLRKDLGLEVAGQRSWVLAAIRYLQRKSTKYQTANPAKANAPLQGTTVTIFHTIFKALDLPSR